MSTRIFPHPTSIPTIEIHPDPDQPRKTFIQAELDALAESLRRHGVLQSVRVRLVGDRWIIIDGHRRWLAAKASGLERVPVIVEERELDAAETTLQSIVANVQRADLDPIERGEAIQRVMRLSGKPASAVAKDAGTSESTASKLLALLTLSEEDKARVRDGQLGLAAAYRLASRAKRSLSEPPMVPRAARSQRPAKQAGAKPIRVRLTTGMALVVRPGTSLDALVATLTDTLSRLRAALDLGNREVAADLFAQSAQ